MAHTRAKAKTWRSTTVKGRAFTLYYSARSRAKQWDVPFSLTKEWIQGELLKGRCAVTGMQFSMEESQAYRATHPFSPSIDRIVSGGPYSPDNCRVVILAVNAAMGAWGEAIFSTVAHAYVSHKNQD